jgi:hypothetical protein
MAKLTRKFPTIRDGDQSKPSAEQCHSRGMMTARREQLHTSPSFDSAFLDAEDEYRPRLDHGSSFRVVETACDAGDDALPCCMDEAESVDCGFHISGEGRYIWVTRHSCSYELEVVGQ